MRLIKKKREPNSLRKYKQAFNASYEELDTTVKEDIQASLLAEQFGVCAYCQQKLTDFSIEHHCERSICNGTNGTIDKTLDYNNLFAVCAGKGGLPKEQHCDTKKANFKEKDGLPMILNPSNAAHIRTLKYKATGLLTSTNPAYEEELNKFLNLNAPYLKAMRREKWGRIFKYSKDKKGQINKDKMSKLLKKDLAMKKGAFTNNFPGLYEYMHKKFCISR